MDINRVKETYESIANKKLSGAITPNTFNQYAYLVNLDIFKKLVGLPETYNPGSPTEGFQINFKNSDDVIKFILDTDINKGTNGYFPRPSNYAGYDYCLFPYIENNCGKTSIKWKSIEPVTGGERAIRLDSFLIPPTMEKPILSWNTLGFKVDPDGVNQIRLSYLRYPVTPFWNFTMQSDQEIFSLAGSTNIEYPDTMFGDFVIRICRYAGIEIREDELLKAALARQLAGQ